MSSAAPPARLRRTASTAQPVSVAAALPLRRKREAKMEVKVEIEMGMMEVKSRCKGRA